MTDFGILSGTVSLTRDYPVPVEQVFAAWSSAEALLDWSAPGEGWVISFEAFDFREGHVDRCLFGPVGGEPWVNAVEYHEIVPNKLIRQTATLKRVGKASFVGAVSVEFQGIDSNHSRLRLIETGLYPTGVDSAEDHENGWSAMLDGLGRYLRSQQSQAA